jgi:hypothetical protein
MADGARVKLGLSQRAKAALNVLMDHYDLSATEIVQHLVESEVALLKLGPAVDATEDA